MRRRLIALTGALGLVAAALAATAGIGSAAPERSADTELSLVAYSTPREAYAKLIPMFQKTAGRQGRRLHAVLRLLRRADARGQGRARGRHRRALARSRRRRARRREPRRREVEEAVLQGHGHELGRRLRRARRQPEEDQELERPPPAGRRGRHAEPVHLGRRALEHHGRVRRRGGRPGKTDKQAQANLLKLFKNVVVQDTSARASLSTFNSGKGDVLLAYENEALLRANAGTRPAVRHPEDDDPHREPDRRRTRRARTRRRRTRSCASCARRPRSRSSPTTATGRS